MDSGWIVEQLSTLSPMYGLQVKGDKAWIRCPFHSRYGKLERTPSLIINLTPSLRYKLGDFRCFGCGEKGSWNALADKLNLQKVDDDEASLSVGSLTSEDKRELFGDDEESIDINSVDWDENVNWRGISGKLVKAIGGQLSYNNYRDDTELYLPCVMDKKEIGGIHCLIERKSKKQMGYINSKGNWAQSALFPFDYVKKNFKDSNVLFLVEGPRDCLNLVQYGIPTLAILGSQNWTEYKYNRIITAFNLDKVVLAFDPDTAGEKAYQKVRKYFKESVKIIRLKMSEQTDPADITKKQAAKIKKALNIDYKPIK